MNRINGNYIKMMARKGLKNKGFKNSLPFDIRNCLSIYLKRKTSAGQNWQKTLDQNLELI